MDYCNRCFGSVVPGIGIILQQCCEREFYLVAIKDTRGLRNFSTANFPASMSASGWLCVVVPSRVNSIQAPFAVVVPRFSTRASSSTAFPALTFAGASSTTARRSLWARSRMRMLSSGTLQVYSSSLCAAVRRNSTCMNRQSLYASSGTRQRVQPSVGFSLRSRVWAVTKLPPSAKPARRLYCLCPDGDTEDGIRCSGQTYFSGD